jgi:hypothetical protein
LWIWDPGWKKFGLGGNEFRTDLNKKEVAGKITFSCSLVAAYLTAALLLIFFPFSPSCRVAKWTRLFVVPALFRLARQWFTYCLQYNDIRRALLAGGMAHPDLRSTGSCSG